MGESQAFEPTIAKVETPPAPAIVPDRRRPLRRLSRWLPHANSTAPASSGSPLTTAPPRPPPQRRKGPISNARRRSATC